MNPKEEAVQAIEQLISDIYHKEFGWIPSWVGKRVIKPQKVRKYAERIMDISEKYIYTLLESTLSHR